MAQSGGCSRAGVPATGVLLLFILEAMFAVEQPPGRRQMRSNHDLPRRFSGDLGAPNRHMPLSILRSSGDEDQQPTTQTADDQARAGASVEPSLSPSLYFQSTAFLVSTAWFPPAEVTQLYSLLPSQTTLFGLLNYLSGQSWAGRSGGERSCVSCVDYNPR